MDGLHDFNHVANCTFILFVVRMEPWSSLLYKLTIDGVLYFSFNSNSNCFIHFGAANNPVFVLLCKFLSDIITYF